MSYNSRINAINTNLRSIRDRIGTWEEGSGPAANGTVWTQSNVTSGLFSGSCFGKGVWVAAGDTNLWWSTDGKTWVECTGSRGYSWTKVYFADGVFLGCAYRGGLWYSTDGVGWTKATCSGSDSSMFDDGSFNDVEYAYGTFVAVDDYTFRSVNGKTWSTARVLNRSTYDVESDGNGRWFSVGYYNVSYSESVYGINWVDMNGSSYEGRCVKYANGILVLTSTLGLWYSTDGTSKSQSNITSGTFNYVHNANGIWVACGTNKGLYYSTNGTTWTQSNITSGTFNYVYNEAGIWIACSESNGLYYSLDGMSWSQSNLTSGTFNHANNANGIWVACDGENGLYYSATWENS